MNRATLPLLLTLVLLGNGLRSVVVSTVFVSEASFASFLNISVAQTSAVIELLLGAVLVSLLISPRLIGRLSVRRLVTLMCLAAAAASLGLGLLFRIDPPLAVREGVVIVLFPIVGFALATLAPLAQLMTGWGGPGHAKLLTGAWAVAMPAAALITPQLVRVVTPRYGLDVYFAGFAMMPVLLILALWILRAPGSAETPAPVPQPGLWVALLALVGFEAATLLVTMRGVAAPVTLVAMAVFAGAFVLLIRIQRRQLAAGSGTDGATLRVFGFLFLANIVTTGFYDTTYLVQHMCSNTLIADRASLGALAQVGAATAATALLAALPIQRLLMVAGGVLTAVGTGSYLLYFTLPEAWVFVGSRAVTGAGMGLLTTAAIFAVTTAAGGSARLALFTAFVIIIGTEAGLELFEIFLQLSDLAGVASDTAYKTIFAAQLAVMVLAMPLALGARKPA